MGTSVFLSLLLIFPRKYLSLQRPSRRFGIPAEDRCAAGMPNLLLQSGEITVSYIEDEMKRWRDLIWLLAVLFAVSLAVPTNWQGRDVVSAYHLQEPCEASVVIPRRHHHHEATLTDASQLYRICSSRPQRILPAQGSRNGRALSSSSCIARQHIVKPLHSYYDSRCRLESAPFCLSASCDYYVIALRHIIR